jgi:hypothetical protein
MIFHRMKTLGAYLFLISTAICFIAAPAFTASRGILVKTLTTAGSARQIKLYSGYHALVVGCGDYRAGWPQLPHPVADAREVAATLKQLDWEVELLEDPGWDRLDTALNRLITGPGRVKDKAVLFWFSGHGHTLEEADGTKLGYIVPVDAPMPAKDEIGFMRRAIDMRQIETVAKRIRSKHVLMVFDSCFSGALFTMVRAAPSHYIEEKITEPVREFITAGRENEKVPDRSVFKVVFIQGIKDGYADFNRDGYVTGEELGAYLQEKVINYSRKAQHPQFGKINNPRLDKGDFVFVLKRPEPAVQSKIDQKAETKQLDTAAAKVEQADQEGEQLTALTARRKKLEAERRRLELEKQAIIESQRKEIKTERLETESPQVASIPREVQTAKVSLRKKSKELSERNINNMLLKYHFFESQRHLLGSFANEFVDNQNDTITDLATGLMWQKRGSAKPLENRAAKKFIKQLNKGRFAGYSDWRMPTLEEMVSLLAKEKRKGLHLGPVFDRRQLNCWTIDHYYLDSQYYLGAWIVSFEDGTVERAYWWNKKGMPGYTQWREKNAHNHVKAVRSLK